MSQDMDPTDLEGGIPRQTARVDNVSHELCDHRIGAKYSMLVCQILEVNSPLLT
jgi:hypothetical protein